MCFKDFTVVAITRVHSGQIRHANFNATTGSNESFAARLNKVCTE